MAWTFYDRFGRQRQSTVTTHPVGSIISYGGSVAPPGWLLCDGGEYPKVSFPELATTLGTTYNSNGTTPISDAVNNFRVPDFRGHSPIGAGTATAGTPGAGVTYTHGTKSGERLHALTVAEVPRHTHGASNPANQNGTMSSAGATANINGGATDGAIAAIASNGVTVDNITAGNTAAITGTSDPGGHSHSAVGGASHHLQVLAIGAENRFDFFKRLGFDTGAASAGTAHTHPQTVEGSVNSGAGARVLADGYIDRIYLNGSVSSEGGHTHTIFQNNHSHTINQVNHSHPISQTNHTHTVIGTTENGTTAGLGAGSPTHNNVGPVLPTNFIIKF